MQSQKIGESATLGREECFLDLNIGRTFLPEGGCKICANLQKGLLAGSLVCHTWWSEVIESQGIKIDDWFGFDNPKASCRGRS